MAGDLVLGIDAGTTAVKAAVFDPRGRRLFDFAAPIPMRRAPGGVAEQDPRVWLDHVATALARVASEGLLAGVGALGLTSQVNTHVFVDAQGRPLAPAITWQDGRAATEAALLDAGPSAGDRLRWWGAPMPIDASHALSRMSWMARHRPDIWERTSAVLLPKDFLLRALTGQTVSDPMSNIGLVGPDLAYIPELLALVPGAAERLAPLRPSAAVAGEAVLAPGLPPVPVAVGIMDAWAGFYGVGLRADGDAAYLSGTSEVIAGASDRMTGEPGLLVFPRHEGLRVHAGPTQSGGASVAWFCAATGQSPEAMSAEVDAAGQDLRTPLFLPHLAGERAPLWDASARGAFLGLEAAMGRPAMARAVFEGVALSARLLTEALERSTDRRAEVLLCGGGGFRSETWNRIRADVLGRPLRRAAVADAGVLGAAALGAVAAGLQPDLPAALADLVAYDRTYEPDPRQAARYDDLFALYRPAYEALRPLSRALAGRA
ncbi:xylulokinase [Rubellimicrobium arenae]|uniref:xylulokinase n=1 Tax=Rubellimicrobium arenae TaxID=2817372 RepID=UPI001FF05BEB|nr:FGGY-family carbohydrate kinase [Rubellimicrobium arenae]